VKENGYKRTKNLIKRTMKYIYTISPASFILTIFFTMLVGLHLLCLYGAQNY